MMTSIPRLDVAFKSKANSILMQARTQTVAKQVTYPLAESILAALLDTFRQGRIDASAGVQTPLHDAFIKTLSLPHVALRTLERIAAAGTAEREILTFGRPIKGRCRWVLWMPGGSAVVVPELAEQVAEPLLALVRLGLATWQDVASSCQAVLIATEEGRCLVSRGGTSERAAAKRHTFADCPAHVLTELRQRAQQITTQDFNCRIHGWEDNIEALIVDALRQSYVAGLKAAPISQVPADAPGRTRGFVAEKEHRRARPAASLPSSDAGKR
jgi:hypothetical protein